MRFSAAIDLTLPPIGGFQKGVRCNFRAVSLVSPTTKILFLAHKISEKIKEIRWEILTMEEQ